MDRYRIRRENMSQKSLDNLLLLALFLTAIDTLIGLFVEIKNQRQACQQEQSDEITKKELRQLHNDINLLKIQLGKIKE